MSTSQRLFSFLTIALLSFAIGGCATGGSGNGGGPSNVRMDMGIATNADLQQQTGDLFRRMQFTVFRSDQAPAPLLESEWRHQTPTDDERALGVTEVQCRIVVRGRERNPEGSLRVFQVTYTMEVLAKTVEFAEWTQLPITDEREAFAREIGQELKTLLLMARG